MLELLVVIALLVILTGVAFSVINPRTQRNKAEDSVRLSNLEKYASALESYANASGSYPASITLDANNVPTSPVGLKDFVSKVPNNEPTSGVIYSFTGVVAQDYFGASVPKASSSTQCFKYYSGWGKIQTCNNANCTGANLATNACL